MLECGNKDLFLTQTLLKPFFQEVHLKLFWFSAVFLERSLQIKKKAIKNYNLHEFNIKCRNAGIKDTDAESSMCYHSQVTLQITIKITL